MPSKAKIKSTAKRLAPSGRGFITGAVTSGVMYLGNHVFHIHLVHADVETALTPFVALLLAAIAHRSEVIKPEVEKVIADVKGVDHKVDPTGTMTDLLTQAIRSRIVADPGIEEAVVKVALEHLGNPPVSAETVLADVKAVSNEVAALAATPAAPVAPAPVPPPAPAPPVPAAQ